eukprot:scaffold130818_cov32-Tisochrysis_lutea.AAC.2
MEAITVSGAAPTPFPAFVTGEKGKPAVIVIQEWWGITDQIKQQAAKIASQGYRVLLPDLYKGKVGVDAEEAHHMMSNLDFSAATVEIADAAAYLKSEGSPAIGITGFCMGGALTMGGLAKSPDIKCAAPFYGVNFGLFDCATLKDKPVQVRATLWRHRPSATAPHPRADSLMYCAVSLAHQSAWLQHSLLAHR